MIIFVKLPILQTGSFLTLTSLLVLGCNNFCDTNPKAFYMQTPPLSPSEAQSTQDVVRLRHDHAAD